MMGRSAIARPWLKAGLFTLLLENEERVLALRADERRKDDSAVRMPASPRSAVVEAASRHQMPQPPFPQVKERQRPAPQPAQSPASAPASSRVARPVAERKAAAASSAVLATPGALPVEEWPERWLALKNRRPLPPQPLVLWTYAGLGEDLTGTPDETRRQVIVRMLMELRHPGGTHVFWPCGFAGETPQDGSALFWSGVKLLNPRVLLLFGSDARDTLSMPKTLLPFCQDRVHGRLVIQLPRPQSLAADEASFKQALAFLSRLLSFCAKRRG